MKNNTQKMVEKLVRDLFIKDQSLCINILEMLHSLFILYIQVEVYQNILKTRCWPVALALYKAFSKTNKRSKIIFLTSLSAWSLKKSVSQVIFYQLAWFNCLLVFSSWDIGQYVYCNYLLAILWRHKFWI